jgi:polar amino acid transport system substrate-binding protein
MVPRLGAALAWLLAAVPLSADDLVIVTSGTFHPMSEVCLILLPEAYARLGLTVRVIEVPPNRADLMVTSGEGDAFVFSDSRYPLSHPGALLVPVPIGYDEIVVFSRSASFKVLGWDSLKPFTIGFLKSMWIVEDHLAGFKAEPANQPDLVLLKLAAGRTDLAVMPSALGLSLLQKHPEITVKVLQPPLETVPLYHFVAAKNAALVPRLAAVFRAMAAEGRIRAVTEQVYRKWNLPPPISVLAGSR